MKIPFLKIITVLITLCVFTKCAQISPLTGGARDVTPPKLIQALPLNKALNFKSDIITLQFDEFIQLKDLTNQLLVSPKLKTEPEIVAEGKTIKIKLKKEELLPNTTYRFYFGKAIVDAHEGNILSNFDYVFSTTSFIDTLKLTGTILEEFNAKPVADMIVGLYDSNIIQDSLCYNTTPNYVSRTNENGEFIFENLPYKQFKVIAFTDKNKNYLYDGETEKIAIRTTNLILNKDTSIKLIAFQEDPSKVFVKKIVSPYYGYSTIILNKKSKIVASGLNNTDAKNLYFPLNSIERDTIEVYYKTLSDTLKLLSNNLITKKIDTLNIILPKQNTKLKKYPLLKFNLTGNNLPLNTNLQLNFLSLIDTLKTNLSKLKITSKEDSAIYKMPVNARWITPYKLQLTTKFKPAVNYKLKIDSAAFYSENKLYNDSVEINFKTETKTDFGKLILKFLLNKKQNYIIQLINDKGQVVREHFLQLGLASSNAVTIDFIDVLPATYKIKIIFDDNEDNKWNTGNYLLKKQPEHIIIYPKAIKIVSDWEVEEEIIIKE